MTDSLTSAARRLLSADFTEDPHPIHARLRAEAPVLRLDPPGVWLLSRFEDVQGALRSPDVFPSFQRLSERQFIRSERLVREIRQLGDTSLVNSDPPVHTRLRRLVSAAFAPRAVARLEERVRALAVEMVGRMLEKDETDLIADLAVPLPVTVISAMLGVDPARRADFKRWSDDLLRAITFDADLPEDEVDRLIASRRELLAFFRAVIDERRARPGDDLISDLVRAEDRGEMLSPEEVLNMTVLLMIAGNETTTHLLGNGTLEILEHPDELRRLRQDPSLIPGFVEETLRFRPPVRFLSRRTARDVPLHGVTLPKGQTVFLNVESANRDPAEFEDPDRFDVARRHQAQLAFGFGIHFCVGAPLARLEARIAFEEMFARLPPFSRKDGPVSWGPSSFLRGPRSLPLLLHHAS